MRMATERPTIIESLKHQMDIRPYIVRALHVKMPSMCCIFTTMTKMAVALLFLAVVLVSLLGTSWNTVDQLPQNLADPSNIKGLGVLIFTDFVVPFEILSIVLLSSLVGAIYLAKGDDN